MSWLEYRRTLALRNPLTVRRSVRERLARTSSGKLAMLAAAAIIYVRANAFGRHEDRDDHQI